MTLHHMAGFVPRKRRVTTTPSAHRIPDQLWGISVIAINITYIRTRQGFLYLAVVLYLASRRVLEDPSQAFGGDIGQSSTGTEVLDHRPQTERVTASGVRR